MAAIKNAIVIGGGIGGLATAAALQRVGIEARVFERAPELRELGAGLTIWSNAMAALAQLGLEKAVQQAGSVVETFDIHTYTGRLLGQVKMAALGLPFPSISIHRRDLLNSIGAVVAPESIRCSKECVSVEETAGSATASFMDGTTETADLVIAADGINSVIRPLLAPANDPLRYAGYTCFRGVAQIQPEDWSQTRLTETVGKGSQFGLLNVGENKIAWYATINGEPREKQRFHKPGYYVREELLIRFAEWHTPITAVLKATPADSVLSNDIYDRQPIKTFARGRLCLLGDAAHPTTPNLGQGACQAIEDAVELAFCLSNSDDLADALKEYEDRRVRRANRVVLQSRMAGDLCQLESGLGCTIRNWLMKLSFAKKMPSGWDWLMNYEPPNLVPKESEAVRS